MLPTTLEKSRRTNLFVRLIVPKTASSLRVSQPLVHTTSSVSEFGNVKSASGKGLAIGTSCPCLTIGAAWKLLDDSRCRVGSRWVTINGQ